MKVLTVLPVALGLAYPALVYLALGFTSPRQVALCVLLLLLARLAALPRARWLESARALGLPALAVGAAMLAGALWDHPLAILAMPALVNFALLVAFAGSLLRREPIVESFARAQSGALDPEEVLYCRRLTLLWSGFFLVNGAISLGLALAATREEWALYTGLVAYLLVGILFSSEFVYRQWRFRHYVGAPSDVVFRRLFPPRPR